ncbi:MAG TPA: prolyl oligopeptidase family serine peptidase, partial [Chryseosolibacter sp.]|nr:prolyl oligopeptidase family serine peptidase [Chryseosolibacter sp.]
MSNRFVLLTFILLITFVPLTSAQSDGTIVSKTSFQLKEELLHQIETRFPGTRAKLQAVDFSKVIYLSDGLKVTAYMAEPKAEGKYPCLITNRGGNQDFGKWNPITLAMFLGRMAEWGYVVIGSQYRGNDGGEGKEEFGGADVHDVLNLIPVLAQNEKADTSRMGIEGTSRGGMMTYLALKETCKFRAAVVSAGMANGFTTLKTRPEMEQVYLELVPDFAANKEKALQSRSAVYWSDAMCKNTPLLIMQGSADWRVTPDQSLELVNKLYAAKHPVRYVFYEGADHSLTEFRDEAFSETKRHFDHYVRDRKPLP